MPEPPAPSRPTCRVDGDVSEEWRERLIAALDKVVYDRETARALAEAVLPLFAEEAERAGLAEQDKLTAVRRAERAEARVAELEAALGRARDAHRDTCLLTTGQASPPAFTCSMCDALTVPTPSADGSESPAGPGWDDHLHRLERRLAELENKVARLSPDEPAPGLGDRLDRANRRITDLTARLNHAEDTLSRARALHAATCPRATGHPCDLCGLLGVSAPAGEGTR